MIKQVLGGLTALFLSSLSVQAGEPLVLKLWPGEMPGPKSFAEGEERDLQKPKDRLVGGKTVMKLGHVSSPEIHVYPAPKDKATGASVVICPGGGFSILAWDLEGVEVAEWLNSIGVTGVVLKYRVPTRQHEGEEKWKGPAIDAQRALSLVRARADDWNLDPERVGILGFSAGGETAGRAAVAKGNRYYEPTDFTDEQSCKADFAVLIYPAYISDKEGKLSKGYEVDADTPPMFFVHAADDPVTCLSSVVLFGALKQAGVPGELHVFRDGGHGYGLRPTDQAVTHWPKRAGAWLGEMGLLDVK